MKIERHLTMLTRKEIPFVWSEEQQEAFEILRDSLITEPLLIYPDFRTPFTLTTDASGYALGAIISQKVEKDSLPITYASQQMNKAEQNYSTTERECLAVVWAVKHFRCYLYGWKITIITDHWPLKWLMNVKDPTSRLACWNLRFQYYDP